MNNIYQQKNWTYFKNETRKGKLCWLNKTIINKNKSIKNEEKHCDQELNKLYKGTVNNTWNSITTQ